MIRFLDKWRQFLSKDCKDYPEKNIAADAEFLAKQDIGPPRFNSLIEIYERDVRFFKESFPAFTLGNLVYYQIKLY